MKLIAHRGNITGKNIEKENSPDYLIDAINQGYDVEVDVWVIDSQLYFGHDNPEYLVSPDIFYKIHDKSWFHCKNLDALNYFINNHSTTNFFWHQKDDFTLTSSNYIWTYPDKDITENSIIVCFEKIDLSKYKTLPYGICSDNFLYI